MPLGFSAVPILLPAQQHSLLIKMELSAVLTRQAVRFLKVSCHKPKFRSGVTMFLCDIVDSERAVLNVSLFTRHESLCSFWRHLLGITSGPGSSVGIATGYGLYGPGIESRWGRDFLYLSLGPPSLLYSGYRVFPRGKHRPGRNDDPSPPSSAVVMKG